MPAIHHKDDLPDNFDTLFKDEYDKIIREYMRFAKGPAKGQAFVDFFEQDMLNDFRELHKQIELVFEESQSEIQSFINQYITSESQIK